MKILMVCLGNICRSPLAEGILSKMLKDEGIDWEVESAGTGSWHIGEPPHKGSIEIAHKNGIDITGQRARQFNVDDFKKFDLILAMDSDNYNNIKSLAKTEEDKNKVKLILNYLHPDRNMAVPDPYFTGDFNEVYTLLSDACQKLLNNLKV